MKSLLIQFLEGAREAKGTSPAIFARDTLKCTPRFYARLCRGECAVPVEMYGRAGAVLGISENDCADIELDGSLTQKTLTRLVMAIVIGKAASG